MIDRKSQDIIFSQISQSKEFQNSEKYLELLRYLLEMAQKGLIPKEKDIAKDVLQKGQDFDPMVDTSVRVYIYRLRKKLENYYQNEGKSSKLQLVMPKGEYHIEIRHPDIREKAKRGYFHIPFVVTLLLCFFLLATVYYVWRDSENFKTSLRPIPKSDEIWSPFINNGLPTLLVLGDHFFYASRENDDVTNVKHIRYHAINSMKELQAFIEKQKDTQVVYYKDTDLFLDRYCSWSLLDILPIFYGYKKKLTLKLASELTWNDFYQYNLLFVGSFKTLGILESVFDNLRVNYELLPLPNKIIIRDSLMTRSRVLPTLMSKTQPFFQREYSYIAKLPGPNHNVLMLLIGFNYLGVESAVKMVTRPDLLLRCERDVRKALNEMPSYFEAVYEVQGFEKTTMYFNYYACFRVPDNYYISQSRK